MGLKIKVGSVWTSVIREHFRTWLRSQNQFRIKKPQVNNVLNSEIWTYVMELHIHYLLETFGLRQLSESQFNI